MDASKYTYIAPSESIHAVVRRMEPAVVLTDAEIDVIMADARKAADEAIADQPESSISLRSRRSYEICRFIVMRKQALHEEADRQDENYRGCVAGFISDTI